MDFESKRVLAYTKDDKVLQLFGVVVMSVEGLSVTRSDGETTLVPIQNLSYYEVA